ncbi:hypothetical protein H2199_004129 [Coniosporium tulheliwenetii]|uniref:Uncharacterized protein n=1 Tax=Coniosporium tulheliwenetii TaxID=3383036 RepID=A0ACC2Z6R9_9PEZI|nr:hypothetical protein H2199_004129 [Cladosporium sp. JES 115]
MFHCRPRAAWYLAITILSLLSLSTAVALEPRATAPPSPIAFAPDQNWDGIDGPWSSFTLRVGTPAQYVRVFASTGSQQTWVVLPQACQNYPDREQCREARGDDFVVNASSTWNEIGNFHLWIGANLGLEGVATYGYDTTVGSYTSEDFFLGVFGLHPKPTNFSTFGEPSPSYMSNLKEQNLIPSLSYGYTAGNQYRLRKVLASLTLGGYDASRFEPNGVSFTFAPDNERDLVVGLQAVSMSDSTRQNINLLPTPHYTYIDSTYSQIWLPVDACRAFEDAFGLIYDDVTELYLVNDTLHNTLLAQNASVVFTLGTTLSEANQVVNITLPYAAFDLTALPYYQGLVNATQYFPLRRAQNETQYILGRAFLQEAYITVDHERSNFSVSQCVWEYGAAQDIVAIPSLERSSTAADGTPGGQSTSSSLSTGAIVGIAVGAAAATALIALLIFFLWWRRRKQKPKPEDEASSDDSSTSEPAEPPEEQTPNVYPKAELDATHVPRHEIDSTSKLDRAPDGVGTPGTPASPYPSEVEAAQKVVFEMEGDIPARPEADGRQLSEKEGMMFREKKYNGVDSTPAPSPTTPTAEGKKRRAPVSPSDIRPIRGSRSIVFRP